ncbi:hypothetical protein [Arthrobacter zhaoguopingii]|uniref:hypothetical protein n=1 Tax=Arthrobacter zhaoguopingii TaxID=2681491 RepID=UPI00135B6945|nr:hypothetical protein [Arthrobacter zhaoguopingii]
MMNLDRMNDTFAQKLRSALVKQVNASSPARARRRRWWVGAGIFAGVGLVGGVGAATAGFFVEPGADIVTEVAARPRESTRERRQWIWVRLRRGRPISPWSCRA